MKENLALDQLSVEFTSNLMHGIIGPEGAGENDINADAGRIIAANLGKNFILSTRINRDN